MSGKLLARDIMTTGVISVDPEDNVQKAANLLLEHHISGLPVVDNAGRVVGVISEGDLVIQDKELKSPAYINILGGIIYLENPQRFYDELKKVIALRVRDLMSPEVFTVGPETPVAKVVEIITERKVNRVPVVDAENKLLGIITRQDIIKATHGQ